MYLSTSPAKYKRATKNTPRARADKSSRQHPNSADRMDTSTFARLPGSEEGSTGTASPVTSCATTPSSGDEEHDDGPGKVRRTAASLRPSSSVGSPSLSVSLASSPPIRFAALQSGTAWRTVTGQLTYLTQNIGKPWEKSSEASQQPQRREPGAVNYAVKPAASALCALFLAFALFLVSARGQEPLRNIVYLTG